MSSYRVGDVVLFGSRVGIIRYYGKLHNDLKNKNTIYAGIETFMTDNDYGNCDGTFNNIRYFNCASNHGVFIDTKQIKRVISKQELLEKLSSLSMKQQQIPAENKNIFKKFHSEQLAFYHNQTSKKWDIVYKIKQSQAKRNVWIVKDYNGKEYIANKKNLYSIPPSDKLSLTQVISLVMNVLSQSMMMSLSKKEPKKSSAKQFESSESIVSSSIKTILSETDTIMNEIKKQHENEKEKRELQHVHSDSLSTSVSQLLQQVNNTNHELQEKIKEMNKSFSFVIPSVAMDIVNNTTNDNVNDPGSNIINPGPAPMSFNYLPNQAYPAGPYGPAPQAYAVYTPANPYPPNYGTPYGMIGIGAQQQQQQQAHPSQQNEAKEPSGREPSPKEMVKNFDWQLKPQNRQKGKYRMNNFGT